MSFIIPDYTSLYCMSDYCVRYSYVLVAIVPFLLFMFWLSRKTFVKFKNRFDLESHVKSRRTDRKLILFMRSVAVIFLMIAIASPFKLESKTVQGDPRLTILVDNSSSMVLYNPNLATDLYKKLEGAIPVNVRTIASGESSPIGTGILNNIEGNDNVLVITDGSNNEGKLLGDIMLFAANINSSVSTLKMAPLRNDVSVTIEGPPELIKDTFGDFSVKVTVAGKNMPYKLQVSEDDRVLILEEEGTGTKELKFSRKFGDGEYHRITARLMDVSEKDDYFRNNNQYFKTVKIVPRPKLLFVTEKQSPLASELDKIYELDSAGTMPSDLSEYMGVIINDLPASKLLPHFDMLNNYIIDGNGVVFLGGESSFDRGAYKGTLLETLLPVRTGAAAELNKSDNNVVILVDISHGTEDIIAYEKALALSVVDSLSEKNNVGAIAFGFLPCQAFTISTIKQLKANKEEIKEKISRLKFDGQTCWDVAVSGGVQLLSGTGGSKNLIMITDGKSTNNQLKTDALNAVRNANSIGVKTFVVGVGTDSDSMATENNQFLANMAGVGGGIYFKTDASNRLKVEFGDPESGKGEEYYNTLVPLDTTHFITLGMDDLSATVSGYNYVVPKPAARLLVSTQKNLPMVVVWRFGLGRVVAFATDDGSKWAGDLLGGKNSRIFTRSINWAIGDLSRRRSYDVIIRDTVIGNNAEVNVIAKEMPKVSSLEFAKVDTNLFSAQFEPKETGYKELLGATYAVNYDSEYSNLGVSEEFTGLVEKTGGKIFEPSDVTGIIEFVKQKSRRIKIDSTDYRWPFAVFAMIIFLLEIALRRYRENIQK